MLTFLKKNPIKVGAILLAFSSLLSRVLGLLRDFVFSSIFGVGTAGGNYALDAYYVAFKIPDFLYSLLILGAISAAFIPLYTEVKKKEGEKASIEFGSQVLTGLMGILIIGSALAWILAPYLIPKLASGFAPELQSLAVTLTRIMLFSPFLMGISSILQGIENVHKSFYGTALAPIVYNASIIFSALFFGRDYGVNALAYGVAFGALLHLLVQIPGTWHSGFRYRFHLPKKNPKWREFLKLSFPRLLGTSALQFTTFVDVFLASFLSLGSLSVYTYAFNLQSLPYGVVAVAVSTAVFSSLSEQADDSKKFVNSIKNSLSQILFWVLPAILGLYLLREPLIQLLLQRGAFDAEATHRTAGVLAILVWAALPQSFLPLFTRGFYARKKTAFPVFAACLAMALTITFNILGIYVYHADVSTLAWGNLLGSSLNAGLLYWGLSRDLAQPLSAFITWKKLTLQTAALVLMILVVSITKNFPVLLQMACAASVYLGTFLSLKRFFKLRVSSEE